MSINTITLSVAISSRMDDGRWLTSGTGTLDGNTGNYSIDCAADLGDAVYDALAAEINDTDGDVTEYQHTVQVDGQEYRADVEEVEPSDLPQYQVRVIPGGDHTSLAALGKLLATGDSLDEIKRHAGDIAGEWYYGVAIVDTDAEVIDWGVVSTDYHGNTITDSRSDDI